MDMVERYIAAVQRELPENKRQEIGRELNANIMDQLDALAEQQQEPLSEQEIAGVLKQMGHPRAVAQQFVPPQPLISPHYIPLYQHTLLIVLGLQFFLQLLDSTSAWLAHSQIGPLLYMKSLASGFFQDAMLGFTSTTVVFWLMSRKHPKQESDSESKWQPQQLPKAGPSWQHIPLQDIFTDLATYLFLLVIIFYPLFAGSDAQSDGFLSQPVRDIMLWCSPLVFLAIASSLWQLRKRFWSRALLVANIVINAAFVVVILCIAGTEPLLQLNSETLRDALQPDQLEHAVQVSLVITALFPGWEVVRDVLRLRKG